MEHTVVAEGVVKRYRSATVLDHVDVTAGPGITGLLGPNGAGKTTLLRTIATVLRPDEGRIRAFGLDPGDETQRREIRRRLGYQPQEPGFFQNFTVLAFLDYVAILKELTGREDRRREVRRVVDLVDLGAVANRKIRKLSGGMRQRVALAQALLGQPQLLILDEPTAGLDPEQRLRFREVVSQVAADYTVLLSTHQTDDVAAVCDRVVVLHEGRVRFEGTPTELGSLAAGRVWLADRPVASARLSWRMGTGRHRLLGDPPAGADLVSPTIEDGYLLLVGSAAKPAEDLV
ncbi:MAG: ATP-binding cassette domain-containing protein [Actinomycetota bacterium]|nr:ATP-binding cassette domain-containing protein [Actinomycetota bacterium]MDQ3640165.1 ATP-binding cassette domain-containing protein [Actinomycetota bacterium]